MEISYDHPLSRPQPRLIALSLAALGVVYGDIGTSTLDAINQIFFGRTGTLASPDNIYGAISLVIWILTIIVTLKDIIFVLKADNKGEGGIFALFGLLERRQFPGAKALTVLLLGAAGLLFADALITPEIS